MGQGESAEAPPPAATAEAAAPVVPEAKGEAKAKAKPAAAKAVAGAKTNGSEKARPTSGSAGPRKVKGRSSWFGHWCRTQFRQHSITQEGGVAKEARMDFDVDYALQLKEMVTADRFFPPVFKRVRESGTLESLKPGLVLFDLKQSAAIPAEQVAERVGGWLSLLSIPAVSAVVIVAPASTTTASGDAAGPEAEVWGKTRVEVAKRLESMGVKVPVLAACAPFNEKEWVAEQEAKRKSRATRNTPTSSNGDEPPAAGPRGSQASNSANAAGIRYSLDAQTAQDQAHERMLWASMVRQPKPKARSSSGAWRGKRC